MDEIKQEEVRQSNNQKRKVTAAVVFAAVAFIGIISILIYIRYKSTHISTDDAFIDGHIHAIASKINGTVKTVLVNDNQSVKAGDLLVEIDVSDYEVKVQEASSALSVEKAKLVEVQARIDAARTQLSELEYRARAARAGLEVQEAQLKQAELDINRADNLFKRESISKERQEKTKTARDVAAAQVKAASEQVGQVAAQIETQKAMIKQAESGLQPQVSLVKQKEASLQAAELNKGYTKIYAPADGRVTKKSVEVGNQIQAGQPLMAVVSLDNDIWVTANYKETQLEKVAPGQKVDIKVDTYPGKTFKGKVDSIMAGTGATFSLFPPENATGNFVKVVQRVPVKIVFEKNTDPEHVLRMGMSVVPTIVIQ